MEKFILKSYGVKDDKSRLLIEVDKDLSEDIERYSKGRAVKGLVRLDDNRFISSKQRKMIWATVGDIADYVGDIPTVMCEYFKIYTMMDYDIEYFSLSDCSMTTANMMIDTLINRCIDWEIPLSAKYIGERVGDIKKYIYKCIETRTCAITGKRGADIHHVDRIGMGRDRQTIDHSKLRLIPLSRDLHTKVHSMGYKEEMKLYKEHLIEPIRFSTKELIKLGIQKKDID